MKLFSATTILLMSFALPAILCCRENRFEQYKCTLTLSDSSWVLLPISPQRAKYDVLWSKNRLGTKVIILTILPVSKSQVMTDSETVAEFDKCMQEKLFQQSHIVSKSYTMVYG